VSDKLDLHNPYISEMIIYKTDFNIGVSRGWNFVMRNHLDTYCLICGDDSYFEAGSLEKLSEKMKTTDMLSKVFINFMLRHVTEGVASSGFISFIVTANTIDKIGYFDENIYPAYYEDIDLWRRIILSKESVSSMEDVFILHGDDTLRDSCTMYSVTPDYRSKMRVCDGRNAVYFHQKWNSRDIEESFPYPFNNPMYNIKDQIPHENYHLNQEILLGHKCSPTITRLNLQDLQ
jgi:hypothetical protein